MRLTDQISQIASRARPHSWTRVTQLNVGMTLLGGSAGLSFPFAADLLVGDGLGSHGLSLIGLLCAVPIMTAGTLLTISALGLKKTHLDIFRRDNPHA